MRASQKIAINNSYRMTPAQRRLSAGATGPAGMRQSARRSVLPRARKAEFAAAITGSLLIISLIIGLLAL
ncbi:hypothetical protein [Neolewinella agarilytica]|uniref:Uncharacterized protein n=1 Tax=Neolewinella agarilytica TaxID=478744 RepID=A0A1H9NZD0_9BACT|nr:hypothetical protein [Neolewinella agarilytica]SER41177.1 hypothetical protein SAMN05444359_1414 [Neolewinella agarilytica]